MLQYSTSPIESSSSFFPLLDTLLRLAIPLQDISLFPTLFFERSSVILVFDSSPPSPPLPPSRGPYAFPWPLRQSFMPFPFFSNGIPVAPVEDLFLPFSPPLLKTTGRCVLFLFPPSAAFFTRHLVPSSPSPLPVVSPMTELGPLCVGMFQEPPLQ